jgi:hypothetical protein
MKKYRTFFDFILSTYIKPDFDHPLSMWEMYLCSIIRSTNSCEAFPFKFNSMFYLTHLNVFKFIDILKKGLK